MNRALRHKVLGGVGCLGLVVLGAVLLRPSRPAPAVASARQAESSGGPATPGAHRAPGCVFHEGDALAYGITMDLTVRFAGGVEVRDAQSLERSMRATLDLRALAVEADRGAVLLARYRDVDKATTASVGDLTEPFLLRVSPTCNLTGFARLDTTAIGPARTQQALAYELSWTWARAESTGSNFTGAYRAAFDVHDDDSSPVVDRRILAYTRPWASEWEHPRTADDDASPRKAVVPTLSLAHIRVGAGPWFESLEGHENVASGKVLDTESRTAARLVAADRGAFDGAPTDRARYVWEDLLPRRVKAANPEVVSAKKAEELRALKGVAVDVAVKQHIDRVSREENIARQWPPLTDYLRARPEMTGEVAKRLRTGKFPDEATASVYVALGRTPTPEALGVLMEIKSDTKAPVIDRTRSLLALVWRDDVGIDLAKSLHSDVKGIANGATRAERLYAREAAMSLGIMGGLRGQTEPEILREGRAAVHEIIQNSRSPITLNPAFKVVANLGDVSMLDVVRPYMEHADAKVRSDVAIAIRRMPPKETTALTVRWLAREQDVTVKRQLYHVLQLQLHDADETASPDIVERAIADLDARPGALTRQSLARILGPLAATVPAARAALLRHVKAEVEAKEGVEEIIGQYLAASDIALASKGAP